MFLEISGNLKFIGKQILYLSLFVVLSVFPMVKVTSAGMIQDYDDEICLENMLSSNLPSDLQDLLVGLEDAEICLGDTHVFDATVTGTSNDGGIKYKWTHGPTTAKINATIEGTYTVTVTLGDLNKTQFSKSVYLKVNSVYVTLPQSFYICDETVSEVELVATITSTTFADSELNYQWYEYNATTSKKDIITGATDKTYTAKKNGSYGERKYTLLAISKDKYGGVSCTGSKEVTVNFIEPIDITLVPEKDEYCVGESIKIESGVTEQGFVGISWSRKENNPDASGIPLGDQRDKVTLEIDYATVNDAGFYEFVIYANGCSYRATTSEIKVYDNPLFFIDREKELCSSSSSTQLSVAGLIQKTGENYSYKWSTGATTSSINVSSPGEYSLEVKVNNLCPVTETVTVHPVINNFSLSAQNGITTACEGSTITLDAKLSDIDAIQSSAGYVWKRNGVVVSGATSSTLSISQPSQSGTYAVTITSIGGCTYTDSKEVTIIPTPTFSLGNDIQLCGGSATFEILNLTEKSGITYEYKLNNALSNSPYTVSSAGSYRVKVIAKANGVSCEYEKTINVTPPLALTINSNVLGDEICDLNQNITISASFSASTSGNVTYKWRKGSDNSSVIHNGSSLTLSDYDESGTYYLEAENNSCTYTASKEVTINYTPEIKSIPNFNICDTGNIKVELLSVNSNISKYRYLIEKNSVVFHNVEKINPNKIENFSVNEAGEYTVTVYADEKCWYSRTVRALEPKLDINIAKTDYCEDDYINISSEITDTYGSSWTHKWYKGSVSSSNLFFTSSTGKKKSPASSNFNKTIGTTKYIAVVTKGVCELTEEVDITINPKPTFDLDTEAGICNNSLVIAPSNISPANSNTYLWKKGGVSVGTQASLTVTQEGVYSLVITSASGCISQTKSISVSKEDMSLTKNECEPNGIIYANVLPNASVVSTYSWAKGGYSGTEIGSAATYTPTTNGTYYLTVVTKNGCTLKSNIDFNAVPNYNLSISPNTGCFDFSSSSKTLTLSSSGGATIPTGTIIEWKKNGNVIAGETGLTLDITEGAEYVASIVNTSGFVCPGNTATASIGEVRNNFCIENNVTGNCDSSVKGCGGSVLLSSSLGNIPNASYEWTKNSGSSVIGGDSYQLYISEKGTNTYTLKVTEGDCTTSTTVDVNIVEVSTLSYPEVEGSFCKAGEGGVTISVNATLYGGASESDIVWYRKPSYSANDATIVPNATGTEIEVFEGGYYQAFIPKKNENGCDVSSKYKMVDYLDPGSIPTFEYIDTISGCYAELIEFYVKINNPDLNSTSYFKYTITNGEGNVVYETPKSFGLDDNEETIKNNYRIGIGKIIPGTYTMESYYKKTGCTSSQEFEVVQNEFPVIEMNDATILCDGLVTLDADPTGKYPNAEFKWIIPSNVTIPSGPTDKRTLIIDKPAIYEVEVTNKGCSSLGSVEIFTSGGQSNLLGVYDDLCSGETKTLDGTLGSILDTAMQNTLTYHWAGPEWDGNASPTTSTVTVTKGGRYTLTITSGDATCDYVEDFDLNVGEEVYPELVNDNYVCKKNEYIGDWRYNTLIIKDPVPGVVYRWYRYEVSYWDQDLTGIYKVIENSGTTYNLSWSEISLINLWKSYGKVKYVYVIKAYVGKCEYTSSIGNGLDGEGLKLGEAKIFKLSKSLSENCEGYKIQVDGYDDDVSLEWRWYKENESTGEYDEITKNKNKSFYNAYGEGGKYLVSSLSDGICDYTQEIEVENIIPKNLIEKDTIYMCSGEVLAVDFSVSEGDTYYVNGAPIGSFPYSSEYIHAKGFKIENQGTYKFRVDKPNTGSGACSISDTLVVKLDPAITVAFIGSNFTGCVGVNVKLTASVTGGGAGNIEKYRWYINGNEQAGEVYQEYDYTIVNKTQDVSVKVWTKGGCTEEKSVEIGPSVVSAIEFEDSEICEGETIELDATTTEITDSSLKYTWKVRGVGRLDTAVVVLDKDGNEFKGPKLVTDVPGTYYITMHTSQCTYNSEMKLTVYNTPYFDLGDDISGCIEEYPKLNVKLNTGIKYDISENGGYKWFKADIDTPNDFSRINGINDNDYIVQEAGVYRAEVTTADGCSFSDTIKIEYLLNPYFSFGDDIDSCTTGSNRLVIKDIDASLTINSISWEKKLKGETSYSSISSSETINDTILETYESGSYMALVETSNGCSFADTINVIYRPQPEVSLALGYNDDSCIANPSIEATITNDQNVIGKLEGLTYVWTKPNGTTVTTSENTLQVTEKGEYEVVVKTNPASGDASCESEMASITVDYKSIPEIIAKVVGGVNCQNEPSVVEVEIINDTLDFGSEDDFVYRWYDSSNNQLVNETDSTLTVPSPGVYSVELVTGSGCISNKATTVSIDYNLTPGVDVSTDWEQNDCQPAGKKIKAEATNIKEGFTGDIIYEWRVSGEESIKDTVKVMNVGDPVTSEILAKYGGTGNYSVAVTVDGCTSEEKITQITYKPMPELSNTLIWKDECIETTDDAYLVVENKNSVRVGALEYIWTLPSGDTKTTTEPKILVEEAGNYTVKSRTLFGGCESPETAMEIEFYPIPKVKLSGVETCQTDDAYIEVEVENIDLFNKDNLTYTWYDNGGNVLKDGAGDDYKKLDVKMLDEKKNIVTTKYSVEVKADGPQGSPCTEGKKTAEVTYHPYPKFDLGNDLKMCEVEVQRLTVNYKNPNLNVTWNTGEKGNSIVATVGGEYIATAELNGCVYSDTINIESIPFPSFEIAFKGIDCDKHVITLGADLLASSSEKDLTYLWSTGETTKNIEIKKGGSYTLTVSKSGCGGIKYIDIKDYFFENFNIKEELGVCIGEDVILKPELEYETIKWSTGSTEPSISISDGGTYTATITNVLLCESTIEYNVISDKAPEITSINVTNKEITFGVTNGIEPFQYFVDDEKVSGKTIPNTFVEGTHILYVKDKYGCDVTQEFYVQEELDVQEVLTPNGDGVNDVWTITDLRKYPRSIVKIYDRYSKLIYKSPGRELIWDGKSSSGEMMPADDYWYFIDFYGNGTNVTYGHFALIR